MLYWPVCAMFVKRGKCLVDANMQPLAMHAIMKNQHNTLPFHVRKHYKSNTKSQERQSALRRH